MWLRSAAMWRCIVSIQKRCWTANSPSSSVLAPLISGFMPMAAAASSGPLIQWVAPRDMSFQRAVLAPFPIGEEAFRTAPAYDFTRPPHPGRLHYENYPWGMDGARFRDLAAQALRELGLA